jgi:hypothetical protein
VTQEWPFPGDSQAERSRWAARWLFEALLEEAPGRAGEIRDVLERFGETWLSDPPDYERHERVDTKQAAALVQVREATIRTWLYRKDVPLTRGPDGKILVAALLEVDANMRRGRSRRVSGS